VNTSSAVIIQNKRIISIKVVHLTESTICELLITGEEKILDIFENSFQPGFRSCVGGSAFAVM
jgi:hypothetical protein